MKDEGKQLWWHFFHFLRGWQNRESETRKVGKWFPGSNLFARLRLRHSTPSMYGTLPILFSPGWSKYQLLNNFPVILKKNQVGVQDYKVNSISSPQPTKREFGRLECWCSENVLIKSDSHLIKSVSEVLVDTFFLPRHWAADNGHHGNVPQTISPFRWRYHMVLGDSSLEKIVKVHLIWIFPNWTSLHCMDESQPSLWWRCCRCQGDSSRKHEEDLVRQECGHRSQSGRSPKCFRGSINIPFWGCLSIQPIRDDVAPLEKHLCLPSSWQPPIHPHSSLVLFSLSWDLHSNRNVDRQSNRRSNEGVDFPTQVVGWDRGACMRQPYNANHNHGSQSHWWLPQRMKHPKFG